MQSSPRNTWGRDDLKPHCLPGPLPTQLTLLSNLEFLAFPGNELTGRSLELLTFGLPFDHAVETGTLPAELFTLSSLRLLRLNNNQFQGSYTPSCRRACGFN